MRLFFALVCMLMIPTPVAGANGQDWPAVTVDGLPGVVLPRDVAGDLVWPVISSTDIDGYWLPGEMWLAKAEEAVADRAATIDDPERTPFLKGYRQYAGLVVDGERLIYINSFCKEFTDWQSNVIIVMDGGPCFWNAIYNVTTGEVEHLYVNRSI